MANEPPPIELVIEQARQHGGLGSEMRFPPLSPSHAPKLPSPLAPVSLPVSKPESPSTGAGDSVLHARPLRHVRLADEVPRVQLPGRYRTRVSGDDRVRVAKTFGVQSMDELPKAKSRQVAGTRSERRFRYSPDVQERRAAGVQAKTKVAVAKTQARKRGKARHVKSTPWLEEYQRVMQVRRDVAADVRSQASLLAKRDWRVGSSEARELREMLGAPLKNVRQEPKDLEELVGKEEREAGRKPRWKRRKPKPLVGEEVELDPNTDAAAVHAIAKSLPSLAKGSEEVGSNGHHHHHRHKPAHLGLARPRAGRARLSPLNVSPRQASSRVPRSPRADKAFAIRESILNKLVSHKQQAAARRALNKQVHKRNRYAMEDWMRRRAMVVKQKVSEQDKARYRQMFDMIDLDDSESIEIDELQAAMKFIGLDISVGELVERMKVIDANYDGEISYDEFVTGFSTINEWDLLLALRQQRLKKLGEAYRRERERLRRHQLFADPDDVRESEERVKKIDEMLKRCKDTTDMPFSLWVPAYHRRRTIRGIQSEGPSFLAALEIRPNKKKRWGEPDLLEGDLSSDDEDNDTPTSHGPVTLRTPSEFADSPQLGHTPRRLAVAKRNSPMAQSPQPVQSPESTQSDSPPSVMRRDSSAIREEAHHARQARRRNSNTPHFAQARRSSAASSDGLTPRMHRRRKSAAVAWIQADMAASGLTEEEMLDKALDMGIAPELVLGANYTPRGRSRSRSRSPAPAPGSFSHWPEANRPKAKPKLQPVKVAVDLNPSETKPVVDISHRGVRLTQHWQRTQQEVETRALTRQRQRKKKREEAKLL